MGSLPPLKLISQCLDFCCSGVHWFKSPATSHIESHQGNFRDKQSPTLPKMATVLHNLSHHKVSLSQRVGTQRPETRRLRDVSCKGRVDQGTRRPRDASTKGRVDQGNHHPRDAVSKGDGRDFSFGETSVMDENNIALYSTFYV
jgi:hypothetical protein